VIFDKKGSETCFAALDLMVSVIDLYAEWSEMDQEFSFLEVFGTKYANLV